MVGFLKRNCSGDLSKESLKLLYISLVCSNLCYASQLWAPQSPTLMLELENIQRRAAPFICKNSELSYKDRFLNLNLLPLYKYIYGIIDINLDNSAQFWSGCSHWGSSGLFLNNKTAKTSLFHDSFFIRITNLWNALPIAIGLEVKFLLRKS